MLAGEPWTVNKPGAVKGHRKIDRFRAANAYTKVSAFSVVLAGADMLPSACPTGAPAIDHFSVSVPKTLGLSRLDLIVVIDATDCGAT